MTSYSSTFHTPFIPIAYRCEWCVLCRRVWLNVISRPILNRNIHCTWDQLNFVLVCDWIAFRISRMEKPQKVRNVKPTIKLSDIDFTPILVAALVILFTIGKLIGPFYFDSQQITFTNQKCLKFVVVLTAIYYLWKKRSQKRTDVLLTGLCEAGKTVTFSQLLFNELRETFTSISENSANYSIDESGKDMQVIDVPGHERLRNRFVDQYKRTAKGIIYVVDSVTVQKDVRDVAEYDQISTHFVIKY